MLTFSCRMLLPVLLEQTRCCARQVAADAPASEIAANLKQFTEGLKAGITASEMSFEHTGEQGLAYEGKDVSGGYFGDFGGRYIPETLVEAHRLVAATLAGLLSGWKGGGSGNGSRLNSTGFHKLALTCPSKQARFSTDPPLVASGKVRYVAAIKRGVADGVGESVAESEKGAGSEGASSSLFVCRVRTVFVPDEPALCLIQFFAWAGLLCLLSWLGRTPSVVPPLPPTGNWKRPTRPPRPTRRSTRRWPGTAGSISAAPPPCTTLSA